MGFFFLFEDAASSAGILEEEGSEIADPSADSQPIGRISVGNRVRCFYP